MSGLDRRAVEHVAAERVGDRAEHRRCRRTERRLTDALGAHAGSWGRACRPSPPAARRHVEIGRRLRLIQTDVCRAMPFCGSKIRCSSVASPKPCTVPPFICVSSPIGWITVPQSPTFRQSTMRCRPVSRSSSISTNARGERRRLAANGSVVLRDADEPGCPRAPWPMLSSSG